ncbi:MAG: DUF58 domain-containing protein [Cellulophaga sp.]
MKKFFKNLYINPRFFIVIATIVALLILSYMIVALFGVIKIVFYIVLLFLIVDFILIFISKGTVYAERLVPEKLSNGDENILKISVTNNYFFTSSITLIDEIPFQFQKRDFKIDTTIKSSASKNFTYSLKPTERGVYSFGNLNVFVKSPIGFISRRYIFNGQYEVPVYPSFLQLKKYNLIAFTNRLFEFGLKKIRRIGHTMEFEQIKEYVQGDDIRNINWKATAKKNQLMVNQYQDEKSQPIYSVIDTGRVMKMPFEELSLLDYAINATLVISSIAIKKQDKAGMFTFSNSIGNRVVADRRSSQMNRILETLYSIKTDFVESDFSRLYIDIKRNITQRGLILLYTNFETMDALNRQLPYLQAITKQHLLVVIFFKNTELIKFANKKVTNSQQIFQKTIAEKFVYEKNLIVSQLQKHGIQTILTNPQDLTINTINKYLEIKARGLL